MSARPRHRIEGELWTLLQLGTYQLAFLDAIPPYAAVNETVLLAKEGDRQGWNGFVNGVLRAVQSAFTDQFADGPSADALPLTSGRYRRLARAFFRDPVSDPVGHMAESFSFPRWLIERWQSRFDLAELCRLGFWFDHPAPLSLRVNPLRANHDDLLANFRSQGVSVAPGSLAEAIRVEGTRRVDSLPGFAEGFFSVQDESAMQAVDLLDPKPGETVLDLCAAPARRRRTLPSGWQIKARSSRPIFVRIASGGSTRIHAAWDSRSSSRCSSRPTARTCRSDRLMPSWSTCPV